MPSQSICEPPGIKTIERRVVFLQWANQSQRRHFLNQKGVKIRPTKPSLSLATFPALGNVGMCYSFFYDSRVFRFDSLCFFALLLATRICLRFDYYKNCFMTSSTLRNRRNLNTSKLKVKMFSFCFVLFWFLLGVSCHRTLKTNRVTPFGIIQHFFTEIFTATSSKVSLATDIPFRIAKLVMWTSSTFPVSSLHSI